MTQRLFGRFALGFAVGYILGARAGRERYRQMVGWWNSFAGNPMIIRAAERGKDLVEGGGRALAEQVQRRVSSSEPLTRNASTTWPEDRSPAGHVLSDR